MSKRLPVILLLTFVLSACTPSAPAQKVVSPRANTPQYQLFNGQYEIVQVEGMNCLVWVSTNGYGMGGITCDWTMYKGGE